MNGITDDFNPAILIEVIQVLNEIDILNAK